MTDKPLKMLEALRSGQKRVPSPRKDAKGHGYKYAKLDQVLDLFHEYFPDFALVQSQSIPEEGGICVQTTVIYAPTGDEITTYCQVPVDRQSGPQGVGSAYSYARRYALLGIMGVAPEDDDGKEAHTNERPKPAYNEILELAKVIKGYRLAFGWNEDGLQMFINETFKTKAFKLRNATANQLHHLIDELATKAAEDGISPVIEDAN